MDSYIQNQLPQVEVTVEEAPKRKKRGFDPADLGDEPFLMPQCPACQRKNILTVTEQVASGKALAVIFLIFLLLGPYAPYGFIFVPLVGHAMGNVRHFCPVCSYEVGTAAKCTCAPKIQNDVITIRIGSCATVISKKALYGVSIFIFTVVSLQGIWNFLEYVGIPDVPKGPVSNRSWEDYLLDCGIRRKLGNELKCQDAYTRFYENKLVEWEGSIDFVKQGFWGKNIGQLTMPKPQTDFKTLGGRIIDARIAGMYDKDYKIHIVFDRALNPQVAEIDPMDKVKFTGTIIENASGMKPPLIFMHEISKIGAPVVIEQVSD